MPKRPKLGCKTWLAPAPLASKFASAGLLRLARGVVHSPGAAAAVIFRLGRLEGPQSSILERKGHRQSASFEP